MTKLKLLFVLFFCFTYFHSFSQKVELAIQTGHSGGITQLSFNPSGKFIASGAKDNKIVIWEINTGKQYNSFSTGATKITGIHFYSDSILISSTSDSTIRFWNIHTNKLTKEIKLNSSINSFDISPSKQKLIIGSSNLCLIDINSSKTSYFEIKAKNGLTTVKFSPSGDYIFVGGKKETYAYLLKYEETNLKISQVRKFRTAILSAIFDASNKAFYTAGEGQLLEFDLEKQLKDGTTSDFPSNTFNDVAVSNNFIYSCNNKGVVYVFNKIKWNKEAILTDHEGKTNCLALSPDGSILASGANDKKIILWNTSNNRLLKILQGSVKQINVVKFTPDNESILIGYSDGTIRASNLKTNVSKGAQLTVSDIKKKLGWGYSIYDIIPITNDSIEIHFLYSHKSSELEGVYDQIEEYFGNWNLSTGNFVVEKNPLPNEVISKYIQDLKRGKTINESVILNNTLTSTSNKDGNLVYSVSEDKIHFTNKNSYNKNYVISGNHADKITCLSINSKYNLLASSGLDGLINFFSLENAELLASYGAFGKSNFIYLNSDGYYFASKGALDDIAFRYNSHIYTFDQFDIKFNRPDLALSKLPYINKTAKTNFSKAYAKRLKKLNLNEMDLNLNLALPETKLILPEKLISETGEFSFKVNCTEKKSSLQNLHVIVDGVPEFTRYGKPITGPSYSLDVMLKLPNGNHTVQVYCTNSKGANSLKETFVVSSDIETKKPNLYLVCIGASEYEQKNFNLKYAAKDAKDVANYFSNLKLFNDVKTKLLLNNEVTLENVQSIETFLNPATENDMVIVFAAGHGVLDKDLDYFFASSNIDFSAPKNKGIPYDVFQDLLDKTKSRKKIMFLDACHSGEIDKDEVKKVDEKKTENGIVFRSAGADIESQEMVNTFELSKNTFADISLSNGASMISSAGGTEYAIEGDQWNNGVFTYALLNALKTKTADANKDNKLMLSELQEYLLNEVQKLTNGKQSPTSRNENLIFDYQIK